MEPDYVELEYAVREEAPWFGGTGLPDEVERELSHYIRREMGQSVHETSSLKARDLNYLGVFPWRSHAVHYWRVRVASESEDSFATIIMYEGVANYEWGSPSPEAAGAEEE